MHKPTLSQLLIGFSLCSNALASVGGYADMHVLFHDTSSKTAPSVQIQQLGLTLEHNIGNKWSFHGELAFEPLDGYKSLYAIIDAKKAYFERNWNRHANLRLGLAPLALGDKYSSNALSDDYSVLRNEYYRELLPANWSSTGAQFFGNTWNQNIEYVFELGQGFDTHSLSTNSPLHQIGNSHQWDQDLNNGIWGARIDLGPWSDFELGASYHQNDLLFNSKTNAQFYKSIKITEAHAKYNLYNFDLSAQWNLNNFEAIDPNAFSIKTSGGWNASIAHNLLSWTSISGNLSPFFEYSDINSTSANGNSDNTEDKRRINMTSGIVYKPTSDLAFKAEYSHLDIGNGQIKTNDIRLGISASY